MRVVGRHKEDVLDGQRALPSVAVSPRPAHQAVDQADNSSRLLVRRRSVAGVRYRAVAEARPSQFALAPHSLLRALRRRLQPILVRDLGDEPAHVWVHAPRGRQELPSLGRDGLRAVEYVVQRRQVRAFRV